MEIIINTLKQLLESQNKTFGIREFARLTNINHTTVR